MASKTTLKKKNSKKNVGALIGSIVILVIVVISFILAPALGDLANATLSDIEMGSYGDEKITYSFVKDTPFKREIATLSSTSTDSSDPRLLMRAYNRAVTKAAAVDEFNSHGYKIPGKQLDEAVINSGYYNVDGVFSAEIFKSTPEARKLEIREAIARELKLESWMFHTLFQQKRSEKSLDFVTNMGKSKRNFKYVTYSYSDYPLNLIEEYGTVNSNNFKELSLSRITLNDEKLADEIIKQIENKEKTFAELAKEHSLDNFKDNGGVISSKTYAHELETIFGITDNSELLSKKPGDKPVKTELDGQYILLAVNKEISDPILSDLSVIENIRSYMLANERGMIEDHFLNKLKNITDLSEANKEIKETGEFALNFGGEQIIPSAINRVSTDFIFNNAIANENFYESLFKLKEKEISTPIVLGDTVSVFELISETETELENQEYLSANIGRSLLNYKTSVEEKRFLKSPKYIDNFTNGYMEILKITQGNN